MSLRTCIMTVDFEDYRRQELRDHRRASEPAHPREVERQLDLLLEIFDSINARATFFTVGRLVTELAPGIWRDLIDRHRIGCHGYEHYRVWKMGPAGFKRDLFHAIDALQDLTSQGILSFRAPYFSSDSCDPWFGEILADAGIRIDSSRRLRVCPPNFGGTLPLAGSGGLVKELPLASIGFGSKRITVIGGTYMRLLPLPWIIRLMDQAQSRGFIPMIYLHPYDLDPSAPPLEYEPGLAHLWPRIGDRVRRIGRHTIAEKLRVLSRTYNFQPAEWLLETATVPSQSYWEAEATAAHTSTMDVVVPMPSSVFKPSAN